MKKKYTLLVLILCVTMVFTSCGTGGTSSNSSDLSDTAYTATQSGQGADKEVTVDEEDVKLETNIVSGDPSEVGPKSLKETVKDTVKGITAVSTDSKNADKTSASDATVDASSIIGSAIESKIESEEKQEEIEKASKTNVSSASDVAGYDENGDPDIPYDELSEEAFEDPDVKYADNAILIKFDKTFGGKLTKGLKKAGIGKLEYIFGTSEYSWYTGYILKSANLAETMENVRNMDNVIAADYNYVSVATADTSQTVQTILTNNEKAEEQSVLNSCGIKNAWATLETKGISAGGSSDVVVAVIDTGVDYTHEDLYANMWRNLDEIEGNGIDDDGNGYVDDYYGVDMTAGKGSAMDDEGHGTHVAGIIAASNNNTGVVGIAYNTQIMAIKAGDASGQFLENNVAKAIIYACENGADVINMSFGSTASLSTVKDALENVYGSSILVASAGNEGKPNQDTDHDKGQPNYPAAYSFVLGVMSVDSTNTESYFSNWDTNLYNSVEYEVYAPGEQILSTLPGDRYAKLSGTSMAAPVVAAEAALLRSYYKDTSKYPTKYIYGQIVGGTDEVTCVNPQKHTVGSSQHNMPGVVNFDKAFNSLPTPDIRIDDYTIFDTAGFEQDTAGKNNGDGVIDAGETFSLGFTLRNRWGMSRDTIVHIDANSATASMPDPYVTILNDEIDYGSVGTYSEIDSGKKKDDGVWVGWENPFYIQVKEDCPNEHVVTINMTVTYKNGLNEEDETVYTTTGQAQFVVRRGVVLDAMIEKDMTLTSNNYYIIPTGTTIAEGATVTVEPGTQIQFWCSDAEDAYAESGIAYLKVEGKFICNGTEDNPVEIFPSSLMNDYRVQIYDSKSGYTKLEYAKITNAYFCDNSGANGVDVAYRCEFTDTASSLRYRYLSSGKVYSSSSACKLTIYDSQECLFYKWGAVIDNGCYNRCAFVDSTINSNTNLFKNCVFYGNNSYEDEASGGVGTLNAMSSSSDSVSLENAVYDKENGVMYMTGLGDSMSINIDNLKKWLGIEYATISTKEEANLVSQILDSSEKTTYKIADTILEKNGELHYENGEAISKELIYSTSGKNYGTQLGTYFQTLIATPITFDSSTSGKAIFQMDIPIYMMDIKLDKYLVDLDLESEYKIKAKVEPANARPSELIYKSDDENVATVSQSGVITPKSIGTTTIKIYSPDEAIYAYMTVNVGESKEPESIAFTQGELSLQVGESANLSVTLTPEDATKWDFTYESDNQGIANVDKEGKVTACSPGDANITVSYGDIKDTITIHCLLDATGITFKENVYITDLTKDDGKDFYPVLSPTGTTETDLEWESANPDICYVDDEGKLIKKSTGIAELRATIKGTEYSASVQIAITNEGTDVSVKKTSCNSKYNSGGIRFYALLDNGTLWTWGGTVTTLKKCTFSGVDYIEDFIDAGSYMYILNNSGVVSKYKKNSDGSYTVSDESFLKNIKKLSDWTYECSNSNYAITNDGAVWSWGYNSKGQLGNGVTSSNSLSTPVQMDLSDVSSPVIDVVSDGSTVLLCEDGNTYILGGSEQLTSPTLLLQNVTSISTSKKDYYFILETNDAYRMIYAPTGVLGSSYSKTHTNEICNGDNCAYIEEGVVYIKGDNTYGQLGNGSSEADSDGYYQMQGMDNVKKVQFFADNVMLELEDGGIYMIGKGTSYELGNGKAENSSTPVKLNFGLGDLIVPIALEGWNHGESETANYTLSENKIILDFDGAISSSSNYGSISLKDSESNALTFNKKIDLDKLYITPTTPLTSGGKYTLTVPAGALENYFQETNEVITITFTYTGTGEVEQSKENTEQESGNSTQPATSNDTSADGANKVVIDEEKLNARTYPTIESIEDDWNQFVDDGLNTLFKGNAILNRLIDNDASKWMRVIAPQLSSSVTYEKISLGGNYWGTTNPVLIGPQIWDYNDNTSLYDVNEGDYLKEAPSDVWPFVVDAYVMVDGERVETVGNQEVTFVVEFNRAMDMSIPLVVKFGSSYPYSDYMVSGEYKTSTRWEGKISLNTLIENGYQKLSISNGKAAGTSMQLFTDWGRFQFKIDTMSAQSMNLQGVATDEGILLTWKQNDFETLAGYNIYRATEENGLYTKLNRSIISADESKWLDDTVEQGEQYYYNFTVVESDLTESEPSGKILVRAYDKMAPGIYHSWVSSAFTGNKLMISATVTDNVAVDEVTLYYRIKGQTEWTSLNMTHINDKYTVAIPAADVTMAGLEYYICASDGTGNETYKGSSEEPYIVTVYETVSESSKGDVDGNGAIEVKDAMMLLLAANSRLNLKTDEFARADLNGDGSLSASEALTILQYVNGTITSLKTS